MLQNKKWAIGYIDKKVMAIFRIIKFMYLLILLFR